MTEKDHENQEGLASALVRTIRDSDLASASIDAAEVLSDVALQPGVLRDLPVLGLIAGFRDAAGRFADEIFARKILAFLTALEQVSKKDRLKMLERLDTEPGFENRVGSRLIGILHRVDDRIKADFIGRAFSAYARSQIDGYILARLVGAIDRIDLADLNRLKAYHLSGHTDDLTLQAFVSVGLAHAPHGMATVHYLENPRLSHPMLTHVLREDV